MICIKHWHGNFATVRGKGNEERPEPNSEEPNSEWPDVLLTCLGTLQPPPRPTQRTSLTVRTAHQDGIDEFVRRDRVSFQDVFQCVVENPNSVAEPYHIFLIQIFTFNQKIL